MYVLVSLYVHKITNKLQYGKMKSAKQPDFSVKPRNGNKLYLYRQITTCFHTPDNIPS